MRKILTLICFLLLTASAAHPQIANQLITISPNGKYLYNSITNQPVFLTGDSPQLLSLQLAANSDVNAYLADRAARGFNAIWMLETDQLDQNGAPNDASGNSPFIGGTWFVNPNSTYWAHQDSVIQQAAANGITVFLMPSFVGNNDGNAYDTPAYHSSSVATIQAYGNFIGNRYKSYNNIVYVLGGDYNPSDST